MLKFLFGTRKTDEPVPETQRQVFERLQRDLNDAIDGLPEKPKVTLDPATGHIALDLPETLPDEALALPSPEEKPDETAAEADETVSETETKQTEKAA